MLGITEVLGFIQITKVEALCWSIEIIGLIYIARMKTLQNELTA